MYLRHTRPSVGSPSSANGQHDGNVVSEPLLSTLRFVEERRYALLLGPQSEREGLRHHGRRADKPQRSTSPRP